MRSKSRKQITRAIAIHRVFWGAPPQVRLEDLQLRAELLRVRELSFSSSHLMHRHITPPRPARSAVVVGLLWPWLSHLGIGRLPGDIYIQGERGSLYIALSLPAVAVLSLTSAALSVVCFASLSVDTFRKLAHRRSRSCNRHARRPIPKSLQIAMREQDRTLAAAAP